VEVEADGLSGNQNDLDWCLAKSCGSQTTEASTNNHHAGYARVLGLQFRRSRYD
jgi:hypothetical protein